MGAPNAAKLVEVLIQKEPGKRFSANQVMRCDYLPVSRPANLTQSAEVYIQKEVERRIDSLTTPWTSRTSERAVSYRQSTGVIKKPLSNRSATSGSYPSPSDSKPSHQSCPGQHNKSKSFDNGPVSAVKAKRSKSYAAEK